MQYDIRYSAPAQRRHTGSYLFVMSHMRSFSSLLCHILGSHPEVSGYAEARQPYWGRVDLDRLARRVRELTGEAVLHRYVLDKILHNDTPIAPSILDRPDVKCVFLLRNAEDTITSNLNMMHAFGHTGRYIEPQNSLDYYTARLRQLEAYSAQLGSKALFIESERLIDDTDAVLEGLTRWLALGEKLKADYKTFPLTGTPGFGDPSSSIKTGSVVKSVDERHRDYVPLQIPEDVMRRGREAYAACREALASRSARV
jgi:hypothetical protein